MREPLVSIITPTKDRPQFLPLLKKCVLSQSYKNLEWLIFDDSREKSIKFLDENSRIQYFYSKNVLSIGEKRNHLIENASGELIIHFDDDDLYAPNYTKFFVESIMKNEQDFLNLRGFFLYHSNTKRYGYWDLTKQNGIHFLFGPDEKGLVQFDKTRGKVIPDLLISYGFGYCYKKNIYGEIKYPEINWQEDVKFAKTVSKFHRVGGVIDNVGLCMHFIHARNTSRSFPQYLIPEFMIPQFFNYEHIVNYINAGDVK